jgi:hypothetical protein
MQGLTDRGRWLAIPFVRGYTLKTKKWLWLFVMYIDEIIWSEGAFKSLVLPEGQKELILAFAESQAINKDSFNDVIQSKGRWHYSPSFRASWCPQDLDRGISGRNHARAFVHDVCRRLGLEPSGIEGALQNIMEMTAKWNAVLVKLVKDKRVRHLASAEGN